MQYPARGLIFDRNGKLLVENQSAYDLMVIPRQIQPFDTLELLSVLGLEKETLLHNLERCRRYSTFKASTLVSQIPADKYAILQEKLYKYPGFFIQTRTVRKYNVSHSADVFGYIGEVSQAQIEQGMGEPADEVGAAQKQVHAADHIAHGEHPVHVAEDGVRVAEQFKGGAVVFTPQVDPAEQPAHHLNARVLQKGEIVRVIFLQHFQLVLPAARLARFKLVAAPAHPAQLPALAAHLVQPGGLLFPVHRRPPHSPTHFHPDAFKLVPGSDCKI